ncbi:MAG TPA: hypothetical protein VGH28_31505 [Polyangiaceae bacterium]
MAEFSKNYPDDADLSTLVDAFEAGDYRSVRAGTARIAGDEKKSDDVKAAARDLRSRTEASRAQIALLVIAALMVAALSTYEVTHHGHDAPRPEPPRPNIERIR